MATPESPSFFRRYKYPILIPLIVLGLALAALVVLSLGNRSPFTYATF